MPKSKEERLLDKAADRVIRDKERDEEKEAEEKEWIDISALNSGDSEKKWVSFPRLRVQFSRSL